MFLSDAQIDYTPMGGIKGIYPDIREWLRHAMDAFGKTQHLVANHQFTIDGDKGTGRVLCASTRSNVRIPARRCAR